MSVSNTGVKKTASTGILLSLLAGLVGVTGCQTAEMKHQTHAEKMQGFATKVQMVADTLPTGYKPMTAEEMTDYVSDSTFSGESTDSPGWFYSIYRSADGEQRGASKNGSDVSADRGTWWIEREMYCGRFSRWIDGKMYCGKYYSNNGQITYVGSDGEVIEQLGYEKGNTKNL